MRHLIELTNIQFAYGEIPALKDTNLNIGAGEAVALMGANGSGKSTLLKLINGLIFAQGGTYAFDGSEITEKSMRQSAFAKAFHQRIGFLFQNPELQLFCTDVSEEIAFGPRQMGLTEDEVERRVADCLDLLEIGALAHRAPYHLSEGEKRKVALAAVLALNPEVLTLDEPLNGLDPRMRRWLAEFLKRLHGAGKTIILSTHDISLVQGIAGRAVLFNEAHGIEADGMAREICADTALLRRVNLVDAGEDADVTD